MCAHNRIMFPMLAEQQPDRMSREQRSFPNSLNIHIRTYTTFNTNPLCRNEFDGCFHVIRSVKRRLCTLRGMWQYLSLPFCTPRVALSVIGEFLLRLVPEDRMLFYTAHEEHREISDVRSQPCCVSVISSSGGSVLTVEGVGVFLWSPEISGLGGTLLELPEPAMCLLSP